MGAIFFEMLTGEKLVSIEHLQSESAEFVRIMKANKSGYERDIFDDVAQMLRSERQP